MHISIAENLPGLIPFKASQQNVFYGRQRQVDDLLSIMQSSRFIGLVGEGKDSLELQQEIVREMRKDHSGLLRSVALRESLHLKNLLIILDQFEDIFQFEEVSRARNNQWD